MNDEEDINYVMAVVAPELPRIENIPGVVSVGITHSKVTKTGKGYQVLVSIESSEIKRYIPKVINGIDVVTVVVGEVRTRERAQEYGFDGGIV